MGDVEYKTPELWSYDKYAEIKLTVMPWDWLTLNKIIHQELLAGRPVVIVPPQKEKK
jgi:hypothetical protein